MTMERGESGPAHPHRMAGRSHSAVGTLARRSGVDGPGRLHRPRGRPNWFTVEETAPDAAQQIAKAKAVCRGCPVRLWCPIHGDETREFGVYTAETYTERIMRLRRWERLGPPA